MLPHGFQGAAPRQEPDIFSRLRQSATEVAANSSRPYHRKSHGFFLHQSMHAWQCAGYYQSKPFTAVVADERRIPSGAKALVFLVLDGVADINSFEAGMMPHPTR